MKNSFWVFALILLFVITTNTPALAGGKKCLCPCPHSRHKARTAARSVPKGKVSVSIPIAGGKSAARAVPIEPGRIYKINHLQKKGVKDYFSLPLEPGTELSLAMKALGRGKTGKPHTGLELLDLKGQSAAMILIDGEADEVKRTSFRPFKTGRYVIAVGSGIEDIGKNQIFFKTMVDPATIDCAINGDAPIPISTDTPREDCFWKENAKDLYHFEGRHRDTYRIEIVLSDGASAGLRAKVGLERRRKSPKILADVSSTGERLTIESVVLPSKGTYSLEIEILQSPSDIIPYTVTITGISVHKERSRTKRHKE